MTLGNGKIYFGDDFLGNYASVTWGTGGVIFQGGVGFTSVNEGSFTSVADESGGVIQVTTDTGDNDNAAFMAGKFAPRDGKMVTRARYKVPAAIDSVAIFHGFAETLALDTPVMPAEFATATMTYNPGGLVGIQYDADGTTDDFRAVMGDGSAAISDSSNGIRANATIANDVWYESVVILNEDGSAEVWFGHSGNLNSAGEAKLTLVKYFKDGTLLTPTDTFYAVLMVENHNGGGAEVFEVDYFGGEAGRDWRVA